MKIHRNLALLAIPLLLIACSSEDGGDDAVGYTPMNEAEAATPKGCCSG